MVAVNPPLFARIYIYIMYVNRPLFGRHQTNHAMSQFSHKGYKLKHNQSLITTTTETAIAQAGNYELAPFFPPTSNRWPFRSRTCIRRKVRYLGWSTNVLVSNHLGGTISK